MSKPTKVEKKGQVYNHRGCGGRLAYKGAFPKHGEIRYMYECKKCGGWFSFAEPLYGDESDIPKEATEFVFR